LDGWHRPGENEAANRHDFAACLAEANAAAVDLLEPSFSDDNLPFGGDPGLFCCWPARDLRSRQPVPVKHRRGPLAQLSRTQGLQAIVTRQEDAAPRGGGPIDARDRVPAVACRRTCRHVILRRSGAYSRSKPRRNTRSPKAGASMETKRRNVTSSPVNCASSPRSLGPTEATACPSPSSPPKGTAHSWKRCGGSAPTADAASSPLPADRRGSRRLRACVVAAGNARGAPPKKGAPLRISADRRRG
jgi:hypothetical protein